MSTPQEPSTQEPSTPPHLIVPTQMSTPPPWFEMNAPSGGVTTRSGGKRFRGGGVTMRGGGVTTRGGGVTMRGGPSPRLFRKDGRFVHAGRFSEPWNSRFEEGDGLTRVNGKLVRTRGRGDGSKASRYPQGIKPIGYGVSYDPVDGEAMLGMQDVIGIPRPAWPPGITPEDCRIHAQSQSQSQVGQVQVQSESQVVEAQVQSQSQVGQAEVQSQSQVVEAQVQTEIALTQSQPLASQEAQVHAANEGQDVDDAQWQEEDPEPVRRSERIKQIIFNKPPAPGPGLKADDAIEV
ncbi:hypothetical protein CTI12_AA223260 [Artemisia annua]|uniref:Uncharacterized protein n=1 Tax=Artemisia annua TaxID=35608 RepID=A0A2U1N0B4_ARTAN|nr:hypothetical protein CTI12_AA223260 [Artemisia annua]